MNAHVERREEAIVTIEVASDRVERHALAQEGHAAHSEPSTPPSRRQRRRDASPAKGTGCVP